MFKLWLILIVPLSVVAFALYGWDKRQAKLDRWRVPEKTLHGVAVIGGWPGAFAGQQFFRHKTRKTSFQVTFWVTVVGHLAMLWCLYGS